MGVQIPSGHAQISFHTLTTGDAEEMIWQVGCSVASITNPPDLAQDAWQAWVDNIASITSSVVDLTRVVLKMGPSSTGATYEVVVTAPGTNGGALLPPNCAVLVRKLTALGGRKGRGRAYLPGISVISGTLDSGGNFSAGNAGTVTTAMNQLLLDIGNGTLSEGAPLELLHSDSTTPTVISAFDCEQKIATQRRRLRP